MTKTSQTSSTLQWKWHNWPNDPQWQQSQTFIKTPSCSWLVSCQSYTSTLQRRMVITPVRSLSPLLQDEESLKVPLQNLRFHFLIHIKLSDTSQPRLISTQTITCSWPWIYNPLYEHESLLIIIERRSSWDHWVLLKTDLVVIDSNKWK